MTCRLKRFEIVVLKMGKIQTEDAQGASEAAKRKKIELEQNDQDSDRPDKISNAIVSSKSLQGSVLRARCYSETILL